MTLNILIMTLWGCLSSAIRDSGDRSPPELSCITTDSVTEVSVYMQPTRAWDEIGVIVGRCDSESDIIIGLNQQPKSMNYSATLLISNISCDDLYIDSYWLTKGNNYYLLP